MNSFGRCFRVEIFGESHGKAVGIVVDGCPAGIELSLDDLEADLARRRSAPSAPPIGARKTPPRSSRGSTRVALRARPSASS